MKKLEPWPNDEAILAQIAECVERAGAPLDAVTVYQKLIQLEASPADKYAFGEARAYLRASRRILSQMRNLPENEIYSSALDNAKSAPPGDPSDTAFATAREHIPQISFDMPLSEMERLLAQFPADAKVSYCIGVVAGRRGMEAYQKATERFPDSLEIPFYEAEMLSETARKQEAIDVYRSILDRRPEMPGVHYLIGLMYNSLGNCQNAVGEFEQEEKVSPRDERLAHRKSVCLLAMGQFDKCYELLRPFVSDPGAPEWMLADYATSAEQTGHTEAAVLALQRVVRLNPSGVEAHYHLYLLYRKNPSLGDASHELSVVRHLKGAAAEDVPH